MSKDILAAGGRRAQFGGPSNISQTTWDEIWADYKPEVEYEVTKEMKESPFRRCLSTVKE